MGSLLSDGGVVCIAIRSTLGNLAHVPVEVVFIHEASTRGDELFERYFGESTVVIDDKRVKAYHGIMPKGDEALEVAHFIVKAAGRQAVHRLKPGANPREDFRLIFRSNPLWSSFIAVDSAQLNKASLATHHPE